MKGIKNKSVYKEMMERDTTYFLFLCGKSEKDFFILPDKHRKAEDYVRLMIISFSLGLNGAMLTLLNEVERKRRLDEISDCFEKIKKRLPYGCKVV